MQLADFDYKLPENLIAQYPAERRDEARLLVVDRKSGELTHDIFANVGRYLPSKSLIVLNNSKVIPARLLGKRPTGGQVEVFLLEKIDAHHYEAMLRPLKKIRDNEPLEFPGGLICRLVDRNKRIVHFETRDVIKKLESAGHIPLPPYIKRADEESDRTNYQTVYAKRPGSVAAPTAGLHMTRPLMRKLKANGHDFAEVTLHVNYGTFKPVEEENILDHQMHFESYRIPAQALTKIKAAMARQRPVVAVGTTSCRTLEAFVRTGETEASTNLFLYPGAEFKMVDALITNFHLPKSTLLMLVSAFGGLDLIRKAYDEAIRCQYRFYSYGDGMLIK